MSSATQTKADAAALAANALPTNGNNMEAMRDAYFDRCREWGEKHGSGKISKVGMILDTAKAAWDGTIVPSKISDGSDAAKAFEGWRAGCVQRAGKALASDGDSASRKNRISEINKYIKVGALPLFKDADMGGYGVLKRAKKIIEDRDDIKGETEDKLSKVATRQLASPAAPLPDDAIVEAITPPNKGEESYVDAVARIRQQIDSLEKKFAPKVAEHVNDHKTMRAIAQKIVDDEGGSSAEIRKREEAAAKEAAKKAAKASKKKKR